MSESPTMEIVCNECGRRIDTTVREQNIISTFVKYHRHIHSDRAREEGGFNIECGLCGVGVTNTDLKTALLFSRYHIKYRLCER